MTFAVTYDVTVGRLSRGRSQNVKNYNKKRPPCVKQRGQIIIHFKSFLLANGRSVHPAVYVRATARHSNNVVWMLCILGNGSNLRFSRLASLACCDSTAYIVGVASKLHYVTDTNISRSCLPGVCIVCRARLGKRITTALTGPYDAIPTGCCDIKDFYGYASANNRD